MPDRDEFNHLEKGKTAAGIFDTGERETVLRFVDDGEKRISQAAGRRPERSAG